MSALARGEEHAVYVGNPQPPSPTWSCSRSEYNGSDFQRNSLCSQETEMLSPHEFATLMLLQHAPDLMNLDSTDLEALLERQLVTLEQLASGQQRPLLTDDGHLLLKAAARIPSGQ